MRHLRWKLCLLGSLLLAAGCAQRDVPKPSQATVPGSGKSTSPTPGTAPQTSPAIAAEALARECHKDGAAADKRYQGKVIEVEGVIDRSVLLLLPNRWNVDLVGFEPEERKHYKVDCRFDENTPALPKLMRLFQGQQVKIRGRYRLAMAPANAVLLDAYELLEVGPDTALHVSAGQLTKELAADAKAAAAKYAKKLVVVEGVVAASTSELDVFVYLEGDPQLEESGVVRIHSGLRKEFEMLRKEQTIKVRAVVKSVDANRFDLAVTTSGALEIVK